MIFVYYIGGPWDLHKVAHREQPKSRLIVREQLPSLKPQEINFTDHVYTVRQVGKDVFVAVSSEIMQ